MMADPADYMHWAKTKERARIDLARSGVSLFSLAGTGADLAGLEINGDHAYGYAPLRQAIASRYGVESANVFSSLGASQGFFLVMGTVCRHGDEVLIEKPGYGPLLAVARFLGLAVKRFERRFEDGFDVDVDAVRAALTPRTRLVVLSDPHNPSGVYLAPETIRRLAAAAGEAGASVLVDEVYREFAAGPLPATAFSFAPGIITTASLTKVFGLAGLRCGWVLAPSATVAGLERLMDDVSPEHVYMSEEFAVRLFPRLDALRAAATKDLPGNLAIVRDFMAGEGRLEWVEPGPGLICFPRLTGGGDGGAFARVLFERFATRVVPGGFFESPAHFRLGFGGEPGLLAEGLANISRALSLV